MLRRPDEPVRLALIPTIGAIEKSHCEQNCSSHGCLKLGSLVCSDARMVTPMIIVYELVAISAAAIAAVALWHRIQVHRRISAIDIRLAKMQKEIEVLQMQESRRVMMALKGNSNVVSPGLDPGDADAVN